MTNPKLNFRLADLRKDDDRRFILDAWLKSWKGSPWAGVIPNNKVSEVTFDAILQLHERGMAILVLESEDPDTKIGFIAWEVSQVPVLHYIYVKPVLRGMGFGKKLLCEVGITPEEPFVYTHRTQDSKKLVGGQHCPAIGRRKELGTAYAKNSVKRGKVRR